MSQHREVAKAVRGRANLSLGALAAAVGVVLALVRSRRTGVEVCLVAAALLLFGLRDLAGGPQRALRVGAWLALLGVAAVAIEPHVH